MRVILLNGAIASGKSTLGKAIVQQRRRHHQVATFYDLDDEVRKVNPSLEWKHGEERLRDWLHSRKQSALKAVNYGCQDTAGEPLEASIQGSKYLVG
jgi:adenosyl cobinamide kinase/adenosyl cobinamide phosphate guanylyltransferase